MHRYCVSMLVATTSLVVTATPATAASLTWAVEFDSPVLRYTADPAERNDVALRSTTDEVRVRDRGDVRLPPDCRRDGVEIVCPQPAETLRVAFRLGDGNDRLSVDAGTHLVEARGDAGNDRLSATGASAELYGGAGDDLLVGSSDTDTMDGEGGDDRISGRAGDDYLRGGTGKDSIAGGSGDDEVEAGDYWDELGRPDARDRIRCGEGKDSANLLHGDRDILPPHRSSDVVHDDCESVWIGLGDGAPLEILDPPIAAGRLRFYVPCLIALSSPDCDSHIVVRTGDGRLVGTDRRRIPGGRSALVGITQTALGRRLARGREPFTVRITVSVFDNQTAGFALRVHP